MGFTLTMWDVKSGSANEGFATSLGFTLTMWDVKHIINESINIGLKVLP